jgi:hypothetical protein
MVAQHDVTSVRCTHGSSAEEHACSVEDSLHCGGGSPSSAFALCQPDNSSTLTVRSLCQGYCILHTYTTCCSLLLLLLLLLAAAVDVRCCCCTNREPEIVLSRGVAMDRKFLQDHSQMQWLGLLFMALCDLATLLLATALFLTPLEKMVSAR